MTPTWLDLDFILMAHQDQVDRHGGSNGVLSLGALEATIAGPRQVLNYEPDSTLFRLAAALGHGFVENHCFKDGNKRIAMVGTETFLLLNGWEIDAPEAQKVVVYEQLAAGELDEKAFERWLERVAAGFDLDKLE